MNEKYSIKNRTSRETRINVKKQCYNDSGERRGKLRIQPLEISRKPTNLIVVLKFPVRLTNKIKR